MRVQNRTKQQKYTPPRPNEGEASAAGIHKWLKKLDEVEEKTDSIPVQADSMPGGNFQNTLTEKQMATLRTVVGDKEDPMAFTPIKTKGSHANSTTPSASTSIPTTPNNTNNTRVGVTTRRRAREQRQEEEEEEKLAGSYDDVCSTFDNNDPKSCSKEEGMRDERKKRSRNKSNGSDNGSVSSKNKRRKMYNPETEKQSSSAKGRIDEVKGEEEEGGGTRTTEPTISDREKRYTRRADDKANKKSKPKASKSIEDISRRTRSGGKKKKKDPENKLLLVYPFSVDEATLSNAASSLKELGGDLLGLENVKDDNIDLVNDVIMQGQSNVEDTGDSKGKSSRTHYVTIGEEDVERLCPGRFLNDSLVDFWMRW